MTDLRKAAQAVVAALEKAPYLRHEAIDALRAALAQPDPDNSLEALRRMLADAVAELKGAQPEQLLCDAMNASHPPAQPAAFTPPQLRRLWDNSPEVHKDAPSFAAFARLARLVEAAHEIVAHPPAHPPAQPQELCQQVNSGVRCGVPRKAGERLCPDCNPQLNDTLAVPRELLESMSASPFREGKAWSQRDMDNLRAVDALLAGVRSSSMFSCSNLRVDIHFDHVAQACPDPGSR